MAKHGAAVPSMFALALVLGAFAAITTGVESIGVCYGVLGNNLPTPKDVVEMYQSKGLTGMRIYSPNQDILKALAGSGIPLIMDTGNGQQLSDLAASASKAASWVDANVKPFQGSVNIKYIAVGNEATGGDAQSILQAMKNVDAALSAAGISGIKVSTSVSSAVTAGFPPSQGTFNSGASHMPPIAQYLATTGAPLLANVYPYFSYVDNQAQIDINYALFTSQGTVVSDNGKSYSNLFDAITDTFFSALESAGAGNVGIVVSESGWPSAGGTAASTSNAQTYNQNLINHVGKGTPKRPGALETYIFAMFNENQKSGNPTEQHFGLFNPDKSPAYSINF